MKHMLPYIFLETISLGPISVQVWGLLVALGIFVGTEVSRREIMRQGIDKEIFWKAIIWILVGAFIGARLFFVVAYAPAHFLSHPWEVFAIWQGGWSMMGGYLGSFVAGMWFFHHSKLSFFSLADGFIFGLPLGIGIGRLGCFFIHDHPGAPTNFFLGVLYPDGIVRHDHGLYLSLIGFATFLLFWFLKKYPRRAGDMVMVFLVIEGVSRFLLDFWRAADVRYMGLTPAQYLAFLFLGISVWMFASRSQRPRIQA
jgi:phosphatidylglycerol:prolipoprotein diacylglycerol transferase